MEIINLRRNSLKFDLYGDSRKFLLSAKRKGFVMKDYQSLSPTKMGLQQ